MNFKWTDEKVEEFIAKADEGYEILEIERRNGPMSRPYVKLKCKQGHIYTVPFQEFKGGRRCEACYRTNVTPEYVKAFIEEDSDSGCKLISEYVNIKSKITLLCRCGNEFQVTFDKFKYRGDRQCKHCRYTQLSEKFRLSRDEVANRIFTLSDGMAVMVSQEYINNESPITLRCVCGNEYTVAFNNFLSRKQYHCQECKNKVSPRKFTYEQVRDYVKECGYKLISTEYKGCLEPIIVECPEGHLYKTTTDSFRQGARCRVCAFNNLRGSNNHAWRGGISTIAEYLRTRIKDWKKQSARSSRYRCVISGAKFGVIHHLTGFNTILEEMFNALDMPIYERVGDYSAEQLALMDSTIMSIHEKYGPGVCITKDIHSIFHNIYGRGNNTPEQFEEFKQRWNNGEFSKQAGD